MVLIAVLFGSVAALLIVGEGIPAVVRATHAPVDLDFVSNELARAAAIILVVLSTYEGGKAADSARTWLELLKALAWAAGIAAIFGVLVGSESLPRYTVVQQTSLGVIAFVLIAVPTMIGVIEARRSQQSSVLPPQMPAGQSTEREDVIPEPRSGSGLWLPNDRRIRSTQESPLGQ